MTPKAQYAKEIGIPVRVMDEFTSAFHMICSVSFMLDRGTIIRQLSDKKYELVESMEFVYKYTEGDDLKLRQLYHEAMFMYEMAQRGFYDDDKTAEYVDKFISHIHTL